MKTFENKVALITGAGSGIGRAIACLFAKEGAKTIVSDIHIEGGMGTMKQIHAAGGEAFFIQADTSKAADNERLVKESVAKYGALHISVNNAGIAGPIATTGEYPIEGWDHVISVNLSGVFYGMRYQIPAILAAGGGSIINMSSILGHVGFAYSSAYTAAKHGIIGLTKASALEYGTHNIRINAICPGFIKTPMVESSLDEVTKDMLMAKHALNRLGTPEEVAELALFLASSKSSFVTGASYLVDGGFTAQ